MTTFTRTWNATYESLPEDDDDALEGASRIRHVRLDVRERGEVDHSWAGDTHDGKHKKVTLRAQGGDPTLDADDCAVYTKADAFGKSRVWLKDELGHVVPMHGGFGCGDIKLTIKNVADSGWVMMNDGTIGNGASGATNRANADTEALFTLLWNNITNTWAPVSGGRGANAAADFAANKTITLPRTLGRALACSGAGSGLTSRALGEFLGTETHVLALSEAPAHSHGGATGNQSADHTHSGTTSSDGAHSHTFPVKAHEITAGASLSTDTGNLTTSTSLDFSIATTTDGSHSHTMTTGGVSANHTHSITSEGGGGAHNNMSPYSFLNVMIKL